MTGAIAPISLLPTIMSTVYSSKKQRPRNHRETPETSET